VNFRVRALLERALMLWRTTTPAQRSLVRAAVRARLQEHRLVVKCAWCGRVSDGDGHWAQVPGLRLTPPEITATICPRWIAADPADASDV